MQNPGNVAQESKLTRYLSIGPTEENAESILGNNVL
jgi:hypothetical protein